MGEHITPRHMLAMPEEEWNDFRLARRKLEEAFGVRKLTNVQVMGVLLRLATAKLRMTLAEQRGHELDTAKKAKRSQSKSKSRKMLSPGFEPGSQPREGRILGH